MKLNSPSFSKGAAIPPRFSCDGQNVSPELQWADLPDDTVSLALICEDPDAPGGVFIHWSIWGLPATKGGLGTGELPSGAHLGRNGFGDVGYGGPCPPTGHGIHHYYFRLYALDREISVPDGAEIGDVRMAIAEATLGMAELMGTYRR